MRLRGLLGGGIAIAMLAAAPAARAECADRPPSALVKESANFAVHDQVTAEQADALLAILEEALGYHTGTLGMPKPPGDAACEGSDRLDVHVRDLPEGLDGATHAHRNNPNGGAASWIDLDVAKLASRTVVAHELFHATQNAIIVDRPVALREATAEWAAARFAGAKPPAGFESAPGLSLDCAGTCSYLQWPFYEHLAERFGDAAIAAVHEQAAVNLAFGTPNAHLDALDKVLADRSSTLAAELSAFGGRTLTGAFAFGPLQGVLARADTNLVLGASNPPPVVTSIPHLATLVMSLSGDPAGPCQVLPLTLRVALPAGAAAAAPSFARDGGPSRALTVDGGTATLTDEWNTCSSQGRLVLVHGGRAPDDALFGVTAALARPVLAPATTGASAPKPRLRLTAARRLRIVKGVLRFRVDVARRGKLTVRLDTKPRIRRVLTLPAGRATVKVRVPRRTRLAKRGNRLSLSFADGAAAKPATVVKRVVLRRARAQRGG